MYFWKDKEGNKISFKVFMQRFKEGCENLTPEQTVKIQFRGTLITMLGIVCGLVISVMGYKDLWWLSLILLGALFNTWVQFVGQNAQRKHFKKLRKGSTDFQDFTKETLDQALEALDGDEIITVSNSGKKKGMSDMGIKIGDLVK